MEIPALITVNRSGVPGSLAKLQSPFQNPSPSLDLPQKTLEAHPHLSCSRMATCEEVLAEETGRTGQSVIRTFKIQF